MKGNEGFLIREAQEADLEGLLELYTHLHNNGMPVVDDGLKALWQGICIQVNHHVLLGVVGERIVSSCVLVVIPNLTCGQRPYGLVENMITRPTEQNNGYATRLLARVEEIAQAQGCYKLMLMTGSKEERTLGLYEKAGYNRKDKTAFVQWL